MLLHVESFDRRHTTSLKNALFTKVSFHSELEISNLCSTFKICASFLLDVKWECWFWVDE